MSTAYHPQTDGPEVVNRCLETYLRCFAQEQPRTWSTYLPWAEFSYNTRFHSAAGTTPFKAVYGRDPPTIVPFVRGETRVADLEVQLLQRDDMLKLLKEQLLKAQTRMKQHADAHRREVT
ncbi:ty3-gypsy retrotransposon protein, partial [Tanacetum coccineum]